MGRPKALVPLAGRTLLDHVLAAVRRSKAGDVVVVLGQEADRVRIEVPLDSATVVVNPRFAEGMSTSIRVGLNAAAPTSRAFLVVLGDQPLISHTTMDTLIDRWSLGGKILIPTFHGSRGNPVLVDRTLASAMDGITGDQGCRAIFPDHVDEITEVAVEDPGILIDVDTEKQLFRVQQALDRGEPLESIAPASSEQHRLHAARAPEADRAPLRPAVDILAFAHELRSRNEPFAMATVVRVDKPTSGRPGNKAIIRPNKDLVGWIGGSCAESVVIAESLAAMRDGHSRVIRLSREVGLAAIPEGVVEHVMECHSGGAMDIYIEPHVQKSQLLIVGDSPIASALAALGRLMDLRVVVVAPGADRAAFPEADDLVDDLERIGDLASPGCYAVVATMGKYDTTAIRQLATSQLAYLGLVSSKKRAAAVLEELREAGVPGENLGHIRSPAGLDLAAETPEEIALSIMAEITKVRRTPPTELPVASAPAPLAADAVGIDPVCGMEVDPASPLRVAYKGKDYVFCSEGCAVRFRKDPTVFLG